MTLKTGEIFWVNLDPALGDEIMKRRPVVILNPGHAKHLKLAIVLPVTQWRPQWEDNPFFVALRPTSLNGLEKESAVDCFQIRAVSHERFLGKIGNASQVDMDEMKRAVALILDIDPEHCL